MRLRGSEVESGYRAAPRAPVAIAELGRVRRRYRAEAAMLAMYGVILVIAGAATYERVTVACSRSTARDLRCTVDTWAFLRSPPPMTVDLLGLDRFDRVQMATGSGKNRRVLDRLFAETRSRRVLLAEGTGLADLHARLEHFRVTPSIPTLVETAQRRDLSAFLGGLGLLVLAVAGFLGRFVSSTVIVLPTLLRVERQRGRWSRTDDVRLDDIVAVVEEGTRNELKLRLVDGTKVTLFSPRAGQGAELDRLVRLARER